MPDYELRNAGEDIDKGVDVGLALYGNQSTLEKLSENESGELLFDGQSMQGADGAPGFSPTITENPDNTSSDYRLNITNETGAFTTPNLKGADGSGGGGNASTTRQPNSTPQTLPNGEFDASWGLPAPPINGIMQGMLDGAWIEIPNTPIDPVRLPVTITAQTREGVLSNQPISIQAKGSGLQTTTLDDNGEFSSQFLTATDYTVRLIRNPGDMFFNAFETFTTGTLNLPMNVDITALLGGAHANPAILDSMRETVTDNAGVTFARTATTFGNLQDSNKWYGGVLAPNGKIYGIPHNSTTVLEIDPETQTTTTFGNLPGTNKWVSGVLAPNGKIYGIPFASTTVLEIDPETQTATTFGNLPGSDKWQGGVLAPNGKIYGIPYNSTTVLEIDPETQTATTFGNFSGTGKWIGGVLAPNGKIYGIPYGSTTVLEIDPETQTTTTFGNLSSTGNWWGGVLAPNGKIYGISFSSTVILEIDPETKTTTTFGNLPGTGKWAGGALAPNGKIYGIPSSSTVVLEIDLGTGLENFELSVLLSAFLNKF